ncbi:hypothetical protein R1sor_008767 [Riccia sorocarpa]|uniref:Uncharacterized protein n=1 Tax=Riccia sorocarpa TaxID=122646 RepID=A0ABD3HW05_9MARC
MNSEVTLVFIPIPFAIGFCGQSTANAQPDTSTQTGEAHVTVDAVANTPNATPQEKKGAPGLKAANTNPRAPLVTPTGNAFTVLAGLNEEEAELLLVSPKPNKEATLDLNVASTEEASPTSEGQRKVLSKKARTTNSKTSNLKGGVNTGAAASTLSTEGSTDAEMREDEEENPGSDKEMDGVETAELGDTDSPLTGKLWNPKAGNEEAPELPIESAATSSKYLHSTLGAQKSISKKGNGTLKSQARSKGASAQKPKNQDK